MLITHCLRSVDGHVAVSAVLATESSIMVKTFARRARFSNLKEFKLLKARQNCATRFKKLPRIFPYLTDSGFVFRWKIKKSMAVNFLSPAEYFSSPSVYLHRRRFKQAVRGSQIGDLTCT